MFLRAVAVSSIQNAINVHNKTPREAILEVILVSFVTGLLFGVPLLCLFTIVRITMISFMSVVVYGTLVAAVSTFTIFKLRAQITATPPISRKFGSHTVDDFQKLVTFVGLIFCCSQIVCAIVIFLVDKRVVDEATTFYFILWFGGAMLSNSMANLIIYLIVSAEFRHLFLEFCCCLAHNEK